MCRRMSNMNGTVRYCTAVRKSKIEYRMSNVIECYLTIQTSNIEDVNIDMIINTNKEFKIATQESIEMSL